MKFNVILFDLNQYIYNINKNSKINSSSLADLQLLAILVSHSGNMNADLQVSGILSLARNEGMEASVLM